MFSFFVIPVVAGSAPLIEWQKSLGGDTILWGSGAKSVEQTNDEGYIIAGESWSNNGTANGNHGANDYGIIKLDQTGKIEWQKSLGGSWYDTANSIQQTNDGGYIIAGDSWSNDGDVTGNHGGYDYWIVKLDQTGNIIWQKSLGGTRHDYGRNIQQTSDGGYIVAGGSSSNNGDVTGNQGEYDCWIVKLDQTGNIIWQKSLGGSQDDLAYSIRQTRDGGYIIASYSSSNDKDVTENQGKYDYWIVKLDQTGNIIWQKSLGGSEQDYAKSVQQTSDGGYIVAGGSSSNNGDVTGNHGSGDYWIVKLDQTGNIIWQKSLGGPWDDYASSIHLTSDGGYIVAGQSESQAGDVTGNHGEYDYWIVKLDQTGNIIWQKSLGGTQDDGANSIQQTTDGGYIVAGFSLSNDGDVTGNQGYDYWIVKLFPDPSDPIQNPIPHIDSLSVTTKIAGDPGFTLEVTGTNFVDGAKVLWEGQERATVFVSATKLTATILEADVASSGTYTIKVENPTNIQSNEVEFVILESTTPVPTTPVPTTPTPTPTLPPQYNVVVIVDRNFDISNPNITITFAGGPGMLFVNTLDCTVTQSGGYIFTGQIEDPQLGSQIVFPGSTGTDRVEVKAQLVNGDNYTIYDELLPFQAIDLPIITTLTPSSITAGSDDFTLEVTGTNFVDGAKVLWEGQERATGFVSATKLTATVLEADVASSGTYTIKVENPNGDGSAELNFEVTSSTPGELLPPPTLLGPGDPNSPGPNIESLTPIFDWTIVPEADEYGLYIKNFDADTLVFDSRRDGYSITGNTFTLPSGFLQPDTHYRWNMNSHSSAGWNDDLVSGYSLKLYFATPNGTQTPVLPVITANLTLSPGPYKVGDTISATYVIRNDGSAPITFSNLTVGGRYDLDSGGDGSLPDGTLPDFSHRSIVLQPAESYVYQGELTFRYGGKYHFFCAYSPYSGDPSGWNCNVPTAIMGINREVDITVTEFKIIINPSKPMVGGQIQFYLNSFYNGEFDSYEWNFDDGELLVSPFSSSVISSHVFLEARKYQIRVFGIKNGERVLLANRELDLSLEPGDILFERGRSSYNAIVPGEWTHTAMYIGDNKIVHIPNKDEPVKKSQISEWAYPRLTYVQVVRVKTTPDVKQKAIDFCLQQAENNAGYDNNWLTKDEDGKTWYCSELIWAAYKIASNGEIDFDDPKMNFNGIAPDEIANSPFVEFIGHHVESRPDDWGISIMGIAFCPVNLQIEDPDGFIINNSINQIPFSEYLLYDLNGDSIEDKIIIINDPKVGIYSLSVIPVDGADLNESYSLYSLQDNYNFEYATALAENIKIKDVPNSPYFIVSNVKIRSSFNIVEDPYDLFRNNITFSDTSTGNITSRQWSFGDGTYAENVTEVTHTYSQSGNYTVRLTVSGPEGEDSTSQDITILPEIIPPASITNLHNTTYQQTRIIWEWTDPASADYDHVMVYLNGVFRENVTQGVQSFTATGLNPATAYTIGTRTVSTIGLINTTWVNNTATTAPEPVFIPAPMASFTASQTLGMIPLTVQFIDTSTGESIAARIWNFGDGNTSTEKNPLHIYTTPGLFTVSLEVTNEGGSNTSTRTNYINATQSFLLIPDFEGIPMVGTAPFEVVFTDTSSGVITTRSWDFGDGTAVWKNETNTVSHIFSIPGIYTISLTSGNEDEQATITKTEYIRVNPSGAAPIARFTTVPMIGYVPMTVRFSDRSMGTPLKWQWDFGDGNSSSEQNPSHTYTTSGRFVVTLTVFNGGGSNSYSSTVWLRPTKVVFPTYNSTSHVIAKPTFPQSIGTAPISFFAMDKIYGSAPMTVQFTDMSFRSPVSWNWDFDDGQTSTLQNPVHTFTMPGTYSVSLTVKNSIGESTTSRRVYVR